MIDIVNMSCESLVQKTQWHQSMWCSPLIKSLIEWPSLSLHRKSVADIHFSETSTQENK